MIYRFNTIPIEFSASCFVGINKLILKFIWRDQRPRIVKNKVRGLTLLHCKTYCKAILNKDRAVEFSWKNFEKINRTGYLAPN